jgi:hypothetical protein
MPSRLLAPADAPLAANSGEDLVRPATACLRRYRARPVDPDTTAIERIDIMI